MRTKLKKNIVLFVLLLLIVLSIYFLENSKVTPSNTGSNTDQELVQVNGETYAKAPELTGISGYLNTNGEEITIQDYLGDHVILVDFWTYSCINCIRTLPYLVDWYDRYKDDGLVIIGVHTPEFGFEKEYDNVEMALEKYGIEYPVVQDNDYATWNAFGNRYWPRKYLIDKEGNIRYDHIGEGGYEETEEKIQELLSELNGKVVEDMSKVSDQTPTTQNTPELYLGYTFALPRGQDIGNEEGLQPDQTIDYTIPTEISPNVVYLTGKWKSLGDYIQAQDEQSSVLLLNYFAKNLNFVSIPLEESIEVDVYLDGAYVPESYAGKDLRYDGKRSYLILSSPDLYSVIDGEYGQHTIQLFTNSTAFTVNSFTFG